MLWENESEAESRGSGVPGLGRLTCLSREVEGDLVEEAPCEQ